MSPAFDSIEVGDRVETAGRTITDADVMNFAGVSGDFNALHTDADMMADSVFGERIAHGALVFSIMTGLLWQTRGRDEHVVAFYGVDNLRFIRPTFVGDTIRVVSEVVDTEPYDHPEANGRVRYDVEVLNDTDELVLSCEMLTLLR